MEEVPPVLTNGDKGGITGSKIQPIHSIRKDELKDMARLEYEITKKNLSKVNESWLQITRELKRANLRNEAIVMEEDFEQELDNCCTKECVLDSEISKLEEEEKSLYQTNDIHMSSLYTLHNERMQNLKNWYESIVKNIRESHSNDKNNINNIMKKNITELKYITTSINEAEEKKKIKANNENSSNIELVKTKLSEEQHQIKFHLENVIEKLRDNCASALQSYRQQTDTLLIEYKKILLADELSSQAIESSMRKTERRNIRIHQWHRKLLQLKAEGSQKNKMLKDEKDRLYKFGVLLKSRLKKEENALEERLMNVSKLAKECFEKIKAQIKKIERILHLHHLCQKLETQREKIMPYYESSQLSSQSSDPKTVAGIVKGTGVVVDKAIGNGLSGVGEEGMVGGGMGTVSGAGEGDKEELRGESLERGEIRQIEGSETVSNRIESSFSPSAAPIGVENSMTQATRFENILKKFNKVIIDNEIFTQERNQLEKENVRLRSVLKQFVDAVSINQEILQQNNPLLIINNKSNIHNTQMLGGGQSLT